MFKILRKLYLSIRVFLYSKRYIFNKIAIYSMCAIMLYAFVDSFVFKRVVVPLANSEQIQKNYRSAISFYYVAKAYYFVNHFTEENKKEYFNISYQISICYLKSGEKKKSIETMLNAITSTQSQYGIFSKETAYFIRRYLIEYYLENDKIDLATQEFKNLMTIHKKIGYSDSEMSDVLRLSGDIYYQQKKYDTAMEFYEKAYYNISAKKEIDYRVFERIVERIAEYKLKKGENEKAIGIYKSSIELLKSCFKPDFELIAETEIHLGDLYAKDDKQVKDAIVCYEDAIAKIKKLPKANYLRQNIVHYMNNLKDLYDRDGQYHKSDEIEIELARQRRFSF